MDQWTISMRTEKGIPSPYWCSLLHGLLLERLPASWQERLHDSGPRPFSQWVEPGDGAAFRWHLAVLNDELAAAVEPLLKSGERWPCKHLQGDFILEASEHQHLTVQAYMKPFFLSEAATPRLRLSFLTTTTHKTQGDYALFPSVELIARGLRARLCDMEPSLVLSDDEVLEQIISHTRIARYRLQSGSFALEGARVQGYTGHVDLSIQGPDSLIRLASVLYCFAPWCGVGIKTALGMGGCRIEPIEYGRK
jgi:CRISPR-associated endoribonuclease Cas6